jgi:hypothetical protein
MFIIGLTFMNSIHQNINMMRMISNAIAITTDSVFFILVCLEIKKP